MNREIRFDYSKAKDFIADHEVEYLAPMVAKAHKTLHSQSGPGSEYAGWLEWPLTFDRDELQRVKDMGKKIQEQAEVLVVIGIGGSYLGTRSALELLNHSFYNQLPKEKRSGPEIYFAGHQISGTYLAQLLELIGDKELMVNVVSKSGTTLEPAIAFRVFRQLLEKRYGREGAKDRIIATTDKARGALKQLADQEGYATFVVPDEVGGRYSVLTPVGLLPLAASGLDVEQMLRGAGQAYHLYNKIELDNNPCYQYAAVRNILYNKGKSIELLVNYEPALQYFAEWWKQLFGESEGKDQKGIFPASANFSTDLHSLGQYIQDGRRNLFATTLWIEEPAQGFSVPHQAEDMDGLNYLAGRDMSEVNAQACAGTMLAHTAGGVPNLQIKIPKIDPYFYGELVYFFEKACGISGYLLGVNPFDQPGVEAYKKNMFALLGKPGFEKEKAILEEKLQQGK